MTGGRRRMIKEGRLLVVQRGPVLRELYSRYLLRKGFDVVVVGTLLSAIAALEENSDFQLVMIEQAVLSAEGLALFDDIKRRWRLPTILVTGDVSVDEKLFDKVLYRQKSHLWDILSAVK